MRAAGAPSKEQLLTMYRLMTTIRRFEEEAEKLSRAGEIFGEIHQYIGQEAVAVGVCSALQTKDIITSTHRGHGHIIAKGGDVGRMMAELYGKAEGYCRGKGGSMHIASLDLGIFGANGIVGAGTPIAVGAALAAKQRSSGSVAVSFFGDGAANQGVVHEAMNLASVYQLPVLFLCENNGYSVSLSVRDSSSVRDIATRALAYGMPGQMVDGMDVLAVYELATEAIEKMRIGHGPMLIEAKTYRFQGHFSGETKLLRGRPYRSEEELASWRIKDPIPNFRALLASTGVASDELDAIEGTANNDIMEAIKFARAATDPRPESALEDVYAVPYPGAVPKGW